MYETGQEVQIQKSKGKPRTFTGIVQAVVGEIVCVRLGAVILKFSKSTGDMLPRIEGGPRALHLVPEKARPDDYAPSAGKTR